MGRWACGMMKNYFADQEAQELPVACYAIYNRPKPWYHIKLLELIHINDMKMRSVPL
ncbi:MAG: hypothetical protein K2M42_10850 [Oscillospiraceae bacterium]|nr:hypothetical protein [Oscillospiraceae bacterium]